MATRPPLPKWRRRADARPAEIAAAAYKVFSDKGYAAAKLDEIAAAAGVSKGALYLYFDTKQDIFEAVVAQALVANIEAIEAMVDSYAGKTADLIRVIAGRVAEIASVSPVGKLLKLVIGESGNFPELARVWHDKLVARAIAMMSKLIRRGQENGEFRAGDPRNLALSLISPMVVAVIFRETFEPAGAKGFDIPALMNQHVETVLNGLLLAGPPRGRGR